MKEAPSAPVYLELQQAIVSASIPEKKVIECWVKTALEEVSQNQKLQPLQPQELTIRIVDKDEMQSLNNTYRHQDKTTNVLSFPFEAPPPIQSPLLGDIVICHDVLLEEAAQQEKALSEHWAHIVIHGVLHLKGYDHINDAEAEIMENLEIKILGRLEIANPY